MLSNSRYLSQASRGHRPDRGQKPIQPWKLHRDGRSRGRVRAVDCGPRHSAASEPSGAPRSGDQPRGAVSERSAAPGRPRRHRGGMGQLPVGGAKLFPAPVGVGTGNSVFGEGVMAIISAAAYSMKTIVNLSSSDMDGSKSQQGRDGWSPGRSDLLSGTRMVNKGMLSSFATSIEFPGRLDLTISMKAVGSRCVLRMVRSERQFPPIRADCCFSITADPALSYLHAVSSSAPRTMSLARRTIEDSLTLPTKTSSTSISNRLVRISGSPSVAVLNSSLGSTADTTPTTATSEEATISENEPGSKWRNSSRWPRGSACCWRFPRSPSTPRLGPSGTPQSKLTYRVGMSASDSSIEVPPGTFPLRMLLKMATAVRCCPGVRS